jgi:predicted RNA-binding protein
VYLERDGEREEVMHDVARINPGDRGLKLTTLLGESRLFTAQIQSIDLMRGSIVLKETTAGSLPWGNAALRAPRGQDQGPEVDASVS